MKTAQERLQEFHQMRLCDMPQLAHRFMDYYEQEYDLLPGIYEDALLAYIQVVEGLPYDKNDRGKVSDAQRAELIKKLCPEMVQKTPVSVSRQQQKLPENNSKER